MDNDIDNRLLVEDYDFVFKTIYNLYKDYCIKWLQPNKRNKLNIKKLLVRDLYHPEIRVKTELESYIWDFRDGLNDLHISILDNIYKNKSINDEKAKFQSRVKTADSINDKIIRKMSEDNGTFPIIKYLNDFLGFRIIDPHYDENINSVINLLDEYKRNSISVTHKSRSNKGYIAYHIYFRVDDYTLPFEIQIWDKKNEKRNLQLHNVYKQGYVGRMIDNYNRF